MALPNSAIGWKGFVLVEDDATFLPYTSFDLTEKDNLLPANDIHGGGIAGQTEPAFASEINVADGALEYNGGIQGNIYAGGGTFGTAFRRIITKAIDYTERLNGWENAAPLKVSPGGAEIYGSDAWVFPGTNANSINRCIVSNMTITAATGALSTWNASFISTTADQGNVTLNAANLEFEATGATADPNIPVPWHQITTSFNANIGETDLEDRVTQISMSIDNQAVPIYTFNRERTMRDVFAGQILVTGSFTYFAEDGAFSQLNKIAGPLSMVFGTGSPITLTVPFLALGVAPIPSGGLNEVIYRTVEFRGLSSGAGQGAINLS